MALKPPGRSGPLIAAAVTVLAMISPVHASTQQMSGPPVTPGSATPAGGAAAPRTITLITGDRVTVRSGGTGPDTTSVQGPDGEPVGAHVTTVGTDTYVYPDSVMPYLGADLLDKRLFNITLLLRDGFDDARTAKLPLIITYRDAATGRRAESVPEGATEVRALTSIQGKAVTGDRDRAEDLWSSLTGGPSPAPERREQGAAPSFANGVAKVWLDGKVKADLADTVAQIGAPSVWEDGNTGEGVDVAVLDTGVDAQHPDLAGQIEASASFVPGEEVTDRNGHGTHVASTIAGTGAASEGREKGVAPGADLHIGKVLGDGGSGHDSWIVAGMEWAARDQKAKIINMSLGGNPTDGTDPLSQAVNALSAETGALFAVAAGNSGPGETTVGTPGASDAALTVGAVDSADRIADFSSRGPRLADRALKPEITAPGVGVLAARSQYSRGGQGHYIAMNGTSMATPHVAGAAALLAVRYPGWTGGQLKDALVSTAKATPDHGPYDGGSGRLDIAATVGSTVFATATAYLGIHPRGGEESGSAERQVTYTNTSDGDVTLDLALRAPGVPDGLMSLSASRVVVPARGTGTVTVSADLSRTPDRGVHTGQIEASGPDGRVLADTVVGVSTEDQPRHLVVEAKGRSGEPMPGSIVILREGDPEGFYYNYITGTGTLDILVPEGTYSVWMWGEVEGTHGPNSLGVALVTAPKVVVKGNTTVPLDAAATREIKAVTPKESVDAQVRLDYHRALGDTASVTDSYILGTVYDSIWTKPGERTREGEMSVTARWRKTQPVLSVEFDGRPFDDLWLLPGSTPPPKGSRHLTAVLAGTGTTADYAGLDVKGRIAVVRPGDIDKQVPAAEKAGAKMLLIVNDGPGRFFDGTIRTELSVAGLSKDRGEQLIAKLRKGRVSLRVVSQPVTDYLYDLVRHWNGTLPESLTYRPSQRELAKVDVEFRNKTEEDVYEYRFDLNPHLRTKVGHSPPPNLSGRSRTDWVTSDDSVRWTTEAWSSTIQFGASTPYRPGGTTREQWFGAIQRPRINDSVMLPRRLDDRIGVEAPGWGDSGADHAGIGAFGALDQMLTLYRGETVVDQTVGPYLLSEVELGPERLPYRLVTTTERDPEAYPYSVRTRTEWGFTSGAGEPGTPARLPLIQLDYAVDTDLEHRAGRSARLTVVPSHLPGGPGSQTIRSAGVEVSYDDGATWSEQRVKRTRDGWETQLRAPSGAEHVTLRARAHDEEGNRVEQTVVRAFGLR